MGTSPVLLGSPAEMADRIRPYVELGFETVIVRMPAPYDRETIDRIAQVSELLGT
jgi:alkanesulfonate monooxygenase SsuD/methylene tetrahydromethanopterin reductase-like flavin-dependent oxidoreductase (luciferase family)